MVIRHTYDKHIDMNAKTSIHMTSEKYLKEKSLITLICLFSACEENTMVYGQGEKKTFGIIHTLPFLYQECQRTLIIRKVWQHPGVIGSLDMELVNTPCSLVLPQVICPLANYSY